MSFGLLVANAVALAAAVAALALLAFPLGRTMRVRNALLLRRGRSEDFRWTPATTPASFRVERAEAPPEIANDVVATGIADIAGDWPRARALVGMLVRHWRREGGIRSDLASTYRRIVAGEGYCVDFVRVYMAAARRADLFCRQWAFSFDGFGGHGHTFVEVFDRQRGAWAFVDVHNNVYAVIGASDVPADALALRSALRDAPASIAFRQAGEGRLGFPVPGKLLAYYLRGVNHWYLWWGNDVVSRERTGLAGTLGKVSGRLAHRLGSALGSPPSIVAVVSPESEDAIAGMERLKRRVIVTATLAAALAALLCVQVAWHWFEQRPA
jgi:hypothetical protein